MIIKMIKKDIKNHMNESNEQGLNLSRSQQRGCSATYNTPFMIQVVCKGFTLPKVCLGRVCSWAKPIRNLVTSGKISGGLAGMDSDLEAFSHNPTGVASGHCLFRQPLNQMPEWVVPLVLNPITMRPQ